MEAMECHYWNSNPHPSGLQHGESAIFVAALPGVIIAGFDGIRRFGILSPETRCKK
jgi:hypothetical protein